MKKNWLWTTAIAGGLLAAPAITNAQTGQGNAGLGSQASANVSLDAIVVTAQRRAENLQDVPISVIAVSSGRLEASGVETIQDIKIVAPGIEVMSNNNYALPVIRGVGSTAVGPGIENASAFYVDGVYYAAAAASLFSFNNIERVEALKGPQGTLFGRNATGGLIQIITKDPEQEFGGKVSIGYGNYETFDGKLYLTGGLTDNLSADLGVVYKNMGDGYGENFATGRDVYQTDHDLGLRAKFLLELGNTEARLSLDYMDNRNSQNAVRMIRGVTAPVPFGPNIDGSDWDINADEDPDVTTEQGGVALRVDHDFGSVQLASISAYRETDYHILFDIDYTPVRGRVGDVKQHDWQFTQELQLLSPADSAIQWVLGAYYLNARGRYDRVRISFLGPAAIPAGPLGTFVQADTFSYQDTESISGFAQATAQIVDNLDLTLGLRYTSEKRDIAGNAFLTTSGGLEIVTTPQTSMAETFNKLTWRVALDYQFTDNVMAYFSYNRGFKSGGFNPSALALPPFTPEVLDAYEIGVKSTFLDNRARLNLAAFYYDYDNLQVKRTVNAAVGTFNGGASRHYGFEAQLDAQLTRDLNLTAGYQYLNAEYTDFPDSVISLPTPAGGELISVGDVTGNTTPFSPKSSFSAALNYDTPVGSDHFNFNVSYYYNSGYFHEPDNRLKEPSYSLVNTSMRYEFDGGYYVSLWGKNLTDVSTATAAGIISFGATGLFRGSYAPPRTYGVTLGLEF